MYQHQPHQPNLNIPEHFFTAVRQRDTKNNDALAPPLVALVYVSSRVVHPLSRTTAYGRLNHDPLSGTKRNKHVRRLASSRLVEVAGA
jgi:hypothetical protein